MTQATGAPAPGPQFDPNFFAQMNAYMSALAAQTGGTYQPAPEPEPEISARDVLHNLAHATMWVNEEQKNRVHRAIDIFVDGLDVMAQDLAAIRARIPVLAEPVTQPQQQVIQQAAAAPTAPPPFTYPTPPPAAPPAAPPQFGPQGFPVPPPPAQQPAPATYPPGFPAGFAWPPQVPGAQH